MEHYETLCNLGHPSNDMRAEMGFNLSLWLIADLRSKYLLWCGLIRYYVFNVNLRHLHTANTKKWRKINVCRNLITN